jgi:hypothetical protein
MEDRLHSISSACNFLGGVSKNTLQGWLSQGRLPRAKVGSRTMVWESALRRMIQDGGKSQGPVRKPRTGRPPLSPKRRPGRPRCDAESRPAA